MSDIWWRQVREYRQSDGTRLVYELDHAAEAIGFSRDTLRKFILQNRLKAFRQYGRVFVAQDDLVAFVHREIGANPVPQRISEGEKV